MKRHHLLPTTCHGKDHSLALAGGICAALLAGSLTLSPRCYGVTDLELGSEAPPLLVVGADGTQAEITNALGQVQVLLFGDSSHESTFQVAQTITSALGDERLEGLVVEWYVVLSKSSDVEVFIDRAVYDASPKPTVLHDFGRTAFGAFNVLVTPSVVVLDGERRIIYTAAGPAPRLPEVFLPSVLRAGNRLSEEAFLSVLTPLISTEPTDEEVRAERWIHLARRLAASGQCDKAQRAYVQALALSPGCRTAHFGLTGLYLGRGDFDAAEAQLLTLLGHEPDSDDAAIALCFVQLARGNGDLAEIKSVALTIVARHPDQASAQILLALAQAWSAEPDR